MNIEAFDPERDREAVHRIWSEIGWAELDNPNRVAAMDAIVDAGAGWVVRQNGAAECAAFTTTGDIDYLGERLPLGGVSAVTTSRVARKQGNALKLTAHAVAQDAANGAIVENLGMFEQGYYDRLGFGSGNYAHWFRFDPQRLRVPNATRIPERLSIENIEEVHAARLARRRSHGSCSFHSSNTTKQRMLNAPNGFGLGYRAADGTLTHCLWAYTTAPEYGPYTVLFYAYQTGEQFIELLGLLKNLGEHVQRIGIIEPPGVQLGDLVDRPIRSYLTTLHSEHQLGMRSLQMWQFRINDLAACLAKTHLACEEWRFNLNLHDPIAAHLPADASWRGAGGEYVVTLGRDCAAEPGQDASLETLEADVPAFSRMWLGVRPASGLNITANLNAPEGLLHRLDEAFRLPAPKRNWPF